VGRHGNEPAEAAELMMKRFKVFVVSLSTCLVIVLLIGAHIGKSASTDDSSYRHMAVFTEVLHRIKSDYVEEPNLANVTLGALNGLLESIDPFASYLNADQYKQYLEHKNNVKGSVGLTLSKRFGYVGVVSTLPGSPAAKAGLATGDLIESIKGVATRDMPLAYAELLLEGAPGSTVDISILRMRHPEPQKITMTRVIIPFPPVSSRMLESQIGYIKPQTLTAGKAAEVATAVKGLEKEGAKGLVLDLRQCAIGVPQEGVAVANLFLDSGLMTYLEGQKIPRKDFNADRSTTVTHLPLVVITNRGTADGAEIAATALLENKRAEVVGERSFGDAALRRAIKMDDGGAIILSVAKYYSADGKAIQDTGVVPSVPFVESEPFAATEEEEEAAPEQPEAKPAVPEQDNMLKKAIEVLTQGAPQAASNKSGQTKPLPSGPRSPENLLTPLNVPKPQQ
jgi:carboxyl-terminal processing protease